MKHVKKFNEKVEVKKEEKVNEHHKHSKKDQIKFICDNIDKLKNSEVEYIYNHIESKLDME